MLHIVKYDFIEWKASRNARAVITILACLRRKLPRSLLTEDKKSERFSMENASICRYMITIIRFILFNNYYTTNIDYNNV